MRATIIPADGFVSVDGEGYSGLNLSFIDASVHAVQWYGASGEVEIKNVMTGKMIENREITSLDEFQQAIAVWQVQKDAAATPDEIKAALGV